MIIKFFGSVKRKLNSHVFQNKWSKRQLLVATTLSAGINYVLVFFLSMDQSLVSALGLALLVKALIVGHNSLVPNYLNPLVHNLISGRPVVWSSGKALSLSIVGSSVCVAFILLSGFGNKLELSLIISFICIYSFSLALYTNVTPLTKFKQRSDVALRASIFEFLIVTFLLCISYFLNNYLFLLVALPVKEFAKLMLILRALEVKFDFRVRWPYEFHKRFFSSIYVRNISLYGSQYFDKFLMLTFIPQQFLGAYIVGSTFGNIVSIFGSNTFLYHIGQTGVSEVNSARRSVFLIAIIAFIFLPFVYFSALFLKYSPVYASFGYFLVSISSVLNALLVLFPEFLQSTKRMLIFSFSIYALIFFLMWLSKSVL